MSLQKEISNALSYITANGYQIHPSAFSFLKEIDRNILVIIQKVIDIKKEQNDTSIIDVNDITRVYTTNEDLEIKPRDSNIQIKRIRSIIKMDSEQSKDHVKDSDENKYFKIIFDSTDYIDPDDGIAGYTKLFKSRFIKSLKILSSRPESKRINKIEYVKKSIRQSNYTNKKSGKYEDKIRENSHVINSSLIAGLVMAKNSRKNNLELIIDDQTGIINTLAVDKKIISQVSNLTLDQMVMVEIENKGSNYIIKQVTSPDIPEHIPSRGESESYVVLISDLHVGSKYFQEIEFLRFLEWLRSPENEIASKINYMCIGGDLIDGVGIFPNQEKELLYNNTHFQISHLTDLLERIPENIEVFAIPGNHDPGRRSLPQPAIPKKDSERLYSLKNFTMLGNPSCLELEGVKILMYHGQGLDDIIATIPGLSYSNPAEAMKILLKARHLSPIYGQRTPISPEQEDILVITEVPDILHSGHIHVMDIQNYRGTLIVNSGAWQNQTPFQQTMGIIPTPGIAILVDLATLRPFQINFNQGFSPAEKIEDHR